MDYQNIKNNDKLHKRLQKTPEFITYSILAKTCVES